MCANQPGIIAQIVSTVNNGLTSLSLRRTPYSQVNLAHLTALTEVDLSESTVSADALAAVLNSISENTEKQMRSVNITGVPTNEAVESALSRFESATIIR